jgi:hypothetical protein
MLFLVAAFPGKIKLELAIHGMVEADKPNMIFVQTMLVVHPTQVLISPVAAFKAIAKGNVTSKWSVTGSCLFQSKGMRISRRRRPGTHALTSSFFPRPYSHCSPNKI